MSEVVAALPPRMTTAEVLALARFGQTTLWRRIKAGTMPKPVDAGQQSIFDRDAVCKALGIVKDESSADTEWSFDPVAFRERRSREVRERAEARRRNRSGVLRGAKAPAALRVVGSDPAARQG